MSNAGDGYTIVGAGAIGGTLAWHLARAGHHITVIDRDEAHIAAISAKGLTLSGGEGIEAQAVNVACTPGEFTGQLGRVLLAVKANATDSAAEWLARHLARDGFVVSMQNGLNEQVIANYVGRERTVGAFVNLFADVVSPGVIAQGGPGAIAIGEIDGADSERVQELVADLQAWGPAIATHNVSGFLWAKLAFGSMLIASSLADAPMADLIDRHRSAMHTLAREIFRVAAAEGISLEQFDAFQPTAYVENRGEREADDATDHLVQWLRTQPKTRSGMWRDMAIRRRPTEANAQYRGAVVAAQRHGVAIPTLLDLLEQIAEVERDPQSMNEARLDKLDATAARL